ncbi:MAG: 3-deoxy-D-manno-octulosonic acid transferase [Candidatus Rokubacteria bacterium]|nr:3-deoxy-D-manno-octulosonic acid transferase [Candidatus Rokubacteria bacterium]
MYLLYSLGLALLGLAYLPAFLVRKVWRGGYPLALAQRLGFVPVAPGPDRIWVHAVSVGEVMAAVPLVHALRRRWPGSEVVVSTVTATGDRVARARLQETAAAFVFPLDFAFAMRRAVRRVRPRCFIALETELWPNLLRTLAAAGVPAVLANGRISDRSFRRYLRVRGLFRRVLEQVALFAMQSDEDARRIIAMGAPPERVVVTGNLKMEAPHGEVGADRLWRRLLHLGDEPVWIAGSTHRGEEAAVLDAFLELRRAGERLCLILAPRHPERIDEVEALARGRGLQPVRRSRIAPGGAGGVVLLDTVGELAALYAVADVIFMGGSLVPIGGHNVIEPALHAKPIVFGPHMGNFREAARLLLQAGAAVQVRDASALVPALRTLLVDADARRRVGEAAWTAVRAHQGACERTLEALEGLLERAGIARADGGPA